MAGNAVPAKLLRIHSLLDTVIPAGITNTCHNISISIDCLSFWGSFNSASKKFLHHASMIILSNLLVHLSVGGVLKTVRPFISIRCCRVLVGPDVSSVEVYPAKRTNCNNQITHQILKRFFNKNRNLTI